MLKEGDKLICKTKGLPETEFCIRGVVKSVVGDKVTISRALKFGQLPMDEDLTLPEEELLTFEEAGACGTAAVISPIERIDDVENGKSYVIAKDGKPGPVCTKLYNKLRGIQYGDEPDTHGWVTIVE